MVQLPSPFADIPRAQLLFDQPSPVERLDRLTTALDCGAKFWIKREDCNSGLAFGGNKVRKLEYIIPDALAQGADTLVTTGGVQSNHMRQTAAVAARYGLKTVLVPRNAVETDSKEYHKLGNVQLNGLMSAQTLPTTESTDEVISLLRSQGQKPYFIPSGGSTHPLGGLGFARWAFELREQEASMQIFFDTIVVSLASGSTLGGMLAGFRCNQTSQHRRRRIIGIQAMTTPKAELEALVVQIANTAAEKIGLHTTDIKWEQDFEVDDRFNAGAYGKLDEATTSSIKRFASLEGILTDPVYTGKAITGLMTKAREGEFRGATNVLFVHTGGQASISAYPELR